MNILLLIAILAAWLVLSLLVASHVGKLLAYARQTQTESVASRFDGYAMPWPWGTGANGETIRYLACLCSRHAVSQRCPIHGRKP